MANTVQNSSGNSSDSSKDKPGSNPLLITSTAAAAQGAAKEDTTLSASGQLAASDSNQGATLAWSVKSDAKGSYGSLTVDATGKWTYTLNNSSAAVQALADGASGKESFTVRVTDSKGATADQLVTINVAGTNDAPVITLNSLTIDGDSSSGKVKGTLLYTDADKGDKHTSGVSLKPLIASSGTPDLSASLSQALHTSINDEGENGKGAVKWDFALPSTAPKLAAGQAVLANYQLSIADNHGGNSAPQDLGLLILGTGSTPKTYSVAAQASLTEGSAAIERASGVVSGKDLGLEDKGSLTSALVMASWSAGSAIPAAASAVLASALSTSTVPTSKGGESDKSIAWQFSAADTTFDFLASGETLTLAYKVSSAKDSDGKAQVITITITGTNDAPVIGAQDLIGAVTEQVTPNGNLTDSGTIAFSDVDLTNVHLVSATGTPVGTTLGTLTAVKNSDTTGSGTGGQLTWTYSVPDSAVEYLAKDQIKVESFTITLDDQNGGLITKQIDVTITGTNDAPVIGAQDLIGAVTEQVTPNGNLTDSGTIAFSDVDLTNVHLVSATGTPVGTTLGTLTAVKNTDTTGSGTGGQLTWTYSVPDSAVEYLAKDQSKVESFTITLDDQNGGLITKQIDVTITGTNDAPVITTPTQQLFAENFNALATSGYHNGGQYQSGLPVEYAASMTNWVAGGTNAFHGVQTSSGNAALMIYQGGSPNIATETNSVAANALGQTYQVSFDVAPAVYQDPSQESTAADQVVVQVVDNSGHVVGNFMASGGAFQSSGAPTFTSHTFSYTGTGTGNVHFVIQGNNPGANRFAGTIDNLTLTTGNQAASLTETTNAADTLGTSGSFAYTDVDTIDTHTVSVVNPANALGTLTATDTNGTVGWTYSVPNASIQYLAAGEQLAQTFTVQVDDHHGGIATTPVTVTINGTNEAPVITSNAAAAVGSVKEDTTLSASGHLTASDVDHNATQSWSVVSANGNNGLNSGTYGSLAVDSNGVWTYMLNNGSSVVEKLAEGEAHNETFTVRVSDDKGAMADQTVTVNVNGTNDAPVMAPADTSGTVTAVPAGPVGAPSPLAFTVEQYLGYQSNSLSALRTYAAAHAANYTVQTNVIDYTDDPSGFAGDLPGSYRWPAAEAQNVNGTGAAINNNFFARITADFSVSTADTYTFRTYNDDGVFLLIDNNLLISDTGYHPEAPFTGSIALAPGNHSIELFFYEGGGEASLEFSARNSTGSFGLVGANGGGLGGAHTTVSDSGAISFSDVDLTDAHVVSAAPIGTTVGTLSAVKASDTTGTGTGGQVDWTYTADNTKLERLAQGETKLDHFNVTVDDQQGGVTTRQVDVSMVGVNDAPIAVADSGSQKNNEVKSYNVLGNDTDVDQGAVLSIATASVAAGSGAVQVVGGQIQFDPGHDFTTLRLNDTRVVNVDYTVADEHGAQANSTLAVTVIGTNTPPQANPDSLTTDEDTSLQFSAAALLANDTDPDPGDTKNIISVTPPTHGTLVDGGNGNYTYTPAPNYNGVDAFSYTMRDAAGEQSSAHVNLNVNAVNDPPVAVNDSNALTVTPLASQIHSNVVHWVNWTSATGVANGPPGTIYGTIDLGNSQTVDVTYTGEYYFAYTNGGTNFYNLTNGTEPAGTYTSAAVANGPNGSSDIIGLALANSPRSLTFSQPVDNLFFAVVSLNNNGYIFDQDFQVASYGPGYWGNGTLTRQALGNGTYEVVGTGEPHGVLAIDGTVSKLTWTSAGTEYWNGFTVGTYGKAQTGTATGNVLTNDSDVEHDSLAVASVNGVAMTGNSVTLTLASGAKLNVNKDGSYLYDENGAFVSLGQGQTTPENFTYTVSDGHGGTSTATATITVTGVNDAPVITSGAQTGAVQAAHPTTTFSGNMTADNQFDIYISADDSQIGTYLGSGNNWGAPFGFNAASLTQGTTNYIHVVAKNLGGPGGILGSFTLSDSNFAFTNGSTVENTTAADWKVSLTGFGSNYLTPVNEGTNGVGPWGLLGGGISSSSNWMWNYYSTNSGDYNTEYFSMKISPKLPAATGQLTASDLDNGATQSWSVFGSASGTYGSLAVNPSTGVWTYSLDNNSNAVLSLAAGAADYDHFTVRVTDDHGATADQTVTVKVTGINDAPTAVNDTATTNEDTAVAIAVLANDTDPDVGDSMTLVSAANAQHGSLAISGSNVVYTPAANYNGADSFTYTIKDAAGAASSATVNITVTPVSDTYVLSNLATNGSFEASTTGWSPIGDGVDVVSSSGWQPGDGTYSLDLNAFHPGGVSQILQTTPGVQYTVGFDLSKNPGDTTYATVQVSAAGNSQSYTFNAANSATNMLWSQQTFSFIATGTTTTLSFASTYPNDSTGGFPINAQGPALDEVVVFANKTIDNFSKGAGGDVLQLHNLLTSISAPQDSTAFSGGYLRFLQSGSNTLVQIDDNGGGDNYLTVATLVGQSLTQADTSNYVL